jgi:hypothetical protein
LNGNDVWIAEICISTRKQEERKKEEICYNQRILLIKEDLVQTIIHNVRRHWQARAEHGCRSLWVTCGFTHGSTCKDPDLQVQVTCSCRSLRVQV